MSEPDLEVRIGELTALADLYRLWRSKRHGDGLPTWSDFDVLELQPWLGNLNLVEVLPAGSAKRFRYRVFGTQIALTVGREMTGKFAEDAPDYIARALLPTYRDVIEAKEPAYHHHDEHGDAGTWRHHRLMLPLSDDGETVSLILVGVEPTQG